MNTKEKREIVANARADLDRASSNVSLPHVKAALSSMLPVLDVLDELIVDSPNPPTRKRA